MSNSNVDVRGRYLSKSVKHGREKAASLLRGRLMFEVLPGLQHKELGLRKKGTAKSSKTLPMPYLSSCSLSHLAPVAELRTQSPGTWGGRPGPERGWWWGHWVGRRLRVIINERTTHFSWFLSAPTSVRKKSVGHFPLTCTCSGEDKANSIRLKKKKKKRNDKKRKGANKMRSLYNLLSKLGHICESEGLLLILINRAVPANRTYCHPRGT